MTTPDGGRRAWRWKRSTHAVKEFRASNLNLAGSVGADDCMACKPMYLPLWLNPAKRDQFQAVFRANQLHVTSELPTLFEQPGPDTA